MCQLQQLLNRCLLLAPRGSLESNSNRHPPPCPDLLSSRVLAYPTQTAPPLNRGKESLPGLYATLLDWHRIRLTCLLYLLVSASPMHVNLFLFSSLHVILIPFGLYYIFNSIFPTFCASPFISHDLSPSVCACIYTVSLVLYYYWWRQL